MGTLWVSAICIATCLLCNTPEGEVVEVRGFLYADEGGELVLADAPQLRSCCLRKGDYLLVEGVPFDCARSQAVTLKGIVSGGKLRNARLIEGSPYPTRTLALTGALVVLIGGTLGWRRRRRRGQ